MKCKLSEMLNASEALKKVAAISLPAKTSYRLMRLAKKFDSEIKTFDAKRFELLKKYGEETAEKKGYYQIKPENVEVFSKEMEGVVSEEVELDYEPITLDMFGEAKLSAIELLNLDAFITQ